VVRIIANPMNRPVLAPGRNCGDAAASGSSVTVIRIAAQTTFWSAIARQKARAGPELRVAARRCFDTIQPKTAAMRSSAIP
jgi:hypothetical protein